MALPSGTRLGPYEILSPIGKGGMGEVYRARDTKLDRDVAIKVLPEELAHDAERVARFEREAKLLASLNHPNIASIYGFESGALVLELVEGPTLAERIAQGAIPVDEAIAIAMQIAEALEAGHEAGVIHRDLKPANIKLKEDGTVKVLDYGLAKALEGDFPSGSGHELSQSPTLTHLRQGYGAQARQGTQVGVILGTAAYMSPEQAKGKRVDKRTDVWAFGAVLYEMLTGRKAFYGEDISETLAAVLKEDPDLDAVPQDTPAYVRNVVSLCLTKDASRRVRDVGDMRLAMDGAFETTVPASSSPAGGWRASTTVASALALCVLTALGVWLMTRSESSPRAIARFTIPLPSETYVNRRLVAMSPDGLHLAYAANNRLHLRAIAETESRSVPGPAGRNRVPFFSPDGDWLGFYADGQLMKVETRGGAPVRIGEAVNPAGASWSEDNTIVFGQPDGIMRVSADGGTPELLVPLPGEREFGGSPEMLPGGDAVLFTLADGIKWDDAPIVVHSLETGTRKVLVERGREPHYLTSGYLLYVQGSVLFAAPFDLDALEVTGTAIPMVSGVMTSGTVSSAANYSVSTSGALVYVSGSLLENENRNLVWVDRNGREEPLAAEPAAYISPRISPDGRRAAVDIRGADNDIWIWDFDRETMSRFTFGPSLEWHPVWSRDGSRVAFSSDRTGTFNLYWKSADGRGTAERLSESERTHLPTSFTPDGHHLLYEEIEAQSSIDVVMMELGGATVPLLVHEAYESGAEISPDGRWLAYMSDDNGQYEVYARPFPNVDDGQWSVSNGEGRTPIWAPDSRELFYIARGGRLMSVRVDTEEGFSLSNPEEIASGYYSARPGGRGFDISPDGERFLMVKALTSDGAPEIVVVLNWREELKQLVP